MSDLEPTLAALRTAVEGGLAQTLEDAKGSDTAIAGLEAFRQALAHAVLGGGKRVRPCLTLLCAQACGMEAPERDPDALRAALAIELLHCYTLVHDDLPAMDNDTERRGQPSVWAKFGQANAILVGDYLQALAFCTLPHADGKALAPLLAQAATDTTRPSTPAPPTGKTSASPSNTSTTSSTPTKPRTTPSPASSPSAAATPTKPAPTPRPPPKGPSTPSRPSTPRPPPSSPSRNPSSPATPDPKRRPPGRLFFAPPPPPPPKP